MPRLAPVTITTLSVKATSTTRRRLREEPQRLRGGSDFYAGGPPKRDILGGMAEHDLEHDLRANPVRVCPKEEPVCTSLDHVLEIQHQPRRIFQAFLHAHQEGHRVLAIDDPVIV